MPPDFRPTASWQNLQLRAAIVRRLRRFFDERGYLEVQTPVLSSETVVDRHLDPLAVMVPHDPRRPDQGRTMWLQTSPEAAMKRLLAEHGRPIYQIGPVFRGGESGPRHNLEFTMLEWYTPGETLAGAMRLLSEVATAALGTPAAELVSYGQAFGRAIEVDPHRATLDELAAAAERLGISVPESFSRDDRDAWLDLLLVEKVQPALGVREPAIVYDFPASQAALAQVRPGTPALAERFELYLGGVELANGYHELLDADELDRRTDEANTQRQQDGKPPLAAPEKLLAAMRAGLPDSCGVALGVDRLVMLAAAAREIGEVLPFPTDRA